MTNRKAKYKVIVQYQDHDRIGLKLLQGNRYCNTFLT